MYSLEKIKFLEIARGNLDLKSAPRRELTQLISQAQLVPPVGCQARQISVAILSLEGKHRLYLRKATHPERGRFTSVRS